MLSGWTPKCSATRTDGGRNAIGLVTRLWYHVGCLDTTGVRRLVPVSHHLHICPGRRTEPACVDSLKL